MDAYILACSGQGDMLIVIVSKETWDWLDAPVPENLLEEGSCCDRENIPAHQLDMMIRKYREDHGEEITKFNITAGSPENDRALMAVSDAPGLNGETFYDMKEAMKAVQKHNLNIVDEYHGYIY